MFLFNTDNRKSCLSKTNSRLSCSVWVCLFYFIFLAFRHERLKGLSPDIGSRLFFPLSLFFFFARGMLEASRRLSRESGKGQGSKWKRLVHSHNNPLLVASCKENLADCRLHIDTLQTVKDEKYKSCFLSIFFFCRGMRRQRKNWRITVGYTYTTTTPLFLAPLQHYMQMIVFVFLIKTIRLFLMPLEWMCV